MRINTNTKQDNNSSKDHHDKKKKGRATKTSTTFHCQQDSVAAASDVWLNELAGAEIKDARREVPAVKCIVPIEHQCSHPRL